MSSADTLLKACHGHDLARAGAAWNPILEGLPLHCARLRDALHALGFELR